MPAEFDRCVRGLMADPKFTPRDPKQTKKDAAFAVCTAQFKQRHGGKLPSESAVMKTEEDGKHPASHYLVVEDPNLPSTWHLRVKDTNGKLDHRLMGAAWAACHEGFRGNKYNGPNKQEAISKLRSMYKSEGMTPPGETKAEVIDDLTLEDLMEIYPDLKLTVMLLNADDTLEG